jgi:beta-glucosidase
MGLKTLAYSKLIYFSGGGIFGGGNLKNAVNSGQVTVARLNQMIAHILAPWYHLGQDSVGHFPNFRIRAAHGQLDNRDILQSTSTRKSATARVLGILTSTSAVQHILL